MPEVAGQTPIRYIRNMTAADSMKPKQAADGAGMTQGALGRDRRSLLKSGAGALAIAALSGTRVQADDSAGNPFRDRFQSFRQTFRVEPDPEEAERILRNIIRGRAVVDDLVDLTAPDIAENGNAVPITFRVQCSMTGEDRPDIVHVLAMGNPFPEVAKYHFSPQSGRAEIAMRCRMRQTSDLVVVADMVDGRVGVARARVNVTLGACS